MHTSYFANYTGDNGIAICTIPPVWFLGKDYRKLAPKNWILFEYKEGRITEEEYIDLYYKHTLDKLNPIEVYNDLKELGGEDAVLLCWCGKDRFCHRHIVAEWLNKAIGTQINELQIV